MRSRRNFCAGKELFERKSEGLLHERHLLRLRWNGNEKKTVTRSWKTSCNSPYHYVSSIAASAPSTAYAVPFPRVERSTSSNHTSLILVFLGRFPIRPVSQSASSYGLASWTGQQQGRLGLCNLGFPRQSGGTGERGEPIGAFV